MIFRTPTDNVQRFIDKALSYIGYTARPNRDNIFGERLGNNGQPWDGAFIDVVAKESGTPIPSLTYPLNGLSEFLKTGRFYNKPRRGDIVFFETSTVSDYGTPHVGIVINTERHAIDGTFETVEGMTLSGMPKRTAQDDGVFKRIRSTHEVMGFGRPTFSTASDTPVPEDATVPRISTAQVRTGIKHKNVETVQLALSVLLNINGLPRGHFDTRTRLAYAKFQRSIGYPASTSTGDVDFPSLQRLATATGLFIAVQ